MSYRKTDTIRRFLNGEVLENVRSLHARTNNLLMRELENSRSGAQFMATDITEEAIGELQFSDIPFCFDSPESISIKNCKPVMENRRRSATSFDANGRISLKELGVLLNTSFAPDPKRENRRPYPSGGAMYPIEVVIGVMRPENDSSLKTGSYHFRPQNRTLDYVQDFDLEKVGSALLGKEKRFAGVAFFILYCMFVEKAIVKYRYRGYRLAMLEVGSMYQCASLNAHMVGLGDRVWSGYGDYELAKHLGLNPKVLLPCIAQLFGKC